MNNIDKLMNAFSESGLPVLNLTAYAIIVILTMCAASYVGDSITGFLPELIASSIMLGMVFGAQMGFLFTSVNIIEPRMSGSEIAMEALKSFVMIAIAVPFAMTIGTIMTFTTVLVIHAFAFISNHLPETVIIIGITGTAIATYFKFKKETEK